MRGKVRTHRAGRATARQTARAGSAGAGGGADEFGDFFLLLGVQDRRGHAAGRVGVDAFLLRVQDSFGGAFGGFRGFSLAGRGEKFVEVRAVVAVGARRVERVAGAAIRLEQGLARLQVRRNLLGARVGIAAATEGQPRDDHREDEEKCAEGDESAFAHGEAARILTPGTPRGGAVSLRRPTRGGRDRGTKGTFGAIRTRLSAVSSGRSCARGGSDSGGTRR